MLAKFVVAMALSQIDDKQYWLKVDTDQCQTIYDGSHPQMNRISFLGRKLTHGTKSIETAYENGIGVVRILSRPVNASTSWLRAVKGCLSNKHLDGRRQDVRPITYSLLGHLQLL